MQRITLSLAVILLAALSVAAQQPEPIAYLAEFKVKPGKEADFIELTKKYDKPLMDRLMAEGTVLAWGLDTAVLHREGGAQFMFWWVNADYAGMDTVFAGFEEMEKQIPAEDQQRFQDIVDLDKHHDHIVRSILLNIREEPPATLPYTSYSSVKVEPGKGNEWRKLWEKYNKPIFDELVADGSILGYGVDVEEFHTEDPAWRMIWVVTTDLASFDKIDAAFAADREARSEEEREAIGHLFRKVTVAGVHRDYLYRSVLVGGME